MKNVNKKATKGSMIKAVEVDTEQSLGLVLEQDKLLAAKYVTAKLAIDASEDNVEREFCKGFAFNHEGQLKAAIKKGFKALKESGAFSGLSSQTVDNLSSMAQYIAALPYNDQDQLFEAVNFRKAYIASRWSTPSEAAIESDNSETAAPVTKKAAMPAPVSFDDACNQIAVQLNDVVETIGDTIKAYPDQNSAALVQLAHDIGKALELAAKTRLQAIAPKLQAVA